MRVRCTAAALYIAKWITTTTDSFRTPSPNCLTFGWMTIIPKHLARWNVYDYTPRTRRKMTKNGTRTRARYGWNQRDRFLALWPIIFHLLSFVSILAKSRATLINGREGYSPYLLEKFLQGSREACYIRRNIRGSSTGRHEDMMMRLCNVYKIEYVSRWANWFWKMRTVFWDVGWSRDLQALWPLGLILEVDLNLSLAPSFPRIISPMSA
jgi:hypothetical protein